METARELIRRKRLEMQTITPEATVYEALRRLSDGDAGALAVLDEDKRPDGPKLIGSVSERDCARRVELQGRSARDVRVKEIMNENPTCVGPDYTVEDCMLLMKERSLRHLPVVDGGRILGLISHEDVVDAVIEHRDLMLDRALFIGHRHHPVGGRGPSRVLLAESNLRQQRGARTALGGTGVTLDIVSTAAAGRERLLANPCDVLCVSREFVDLVALALERNPRVRPVFIGAEDIPDYLDLLRQYDRISNIVVRQESDSFSAVRDMMTTIGKLISGKLFGLEKYLLWGAEVQAHTVRGSDERGDLISAMESYLGGIGLRPGVIRRVTTAADELLMNVIWDAPHDANGAALYNHLDRKIPLKLKSEEQATFRYACDGMLVAISAEDPFGALARSTVLAYLERTYRNAEAMTVVDKGGAGLGLYMTMESSDLVVFNVKQKAKTEVIALFNLDRNVKKARGSFHYFSDQEGA